MGLFYLCALRLVGGGAEGLVDEVAETFVGSGVLRGDLGAIDEEGGGAGDAL